MRRWACRRDPKRANSRRRLAWIRALQVSETAAAPVRRREQRAASALRDGRECRVAWRLSHKPPTDPVRRSVMGRPMLRTTEGGPQVGRARHQGNESRYVPHQLCSKAFRTPLCNSLHGNGQRRTGGGGRSRRTCRRREVVGVHHPDHPQFADLVAVQGARAPRSWGQVRRSRATPMSSTRRRRWASSRRGTARG
jgi:hypothetical protein